MFEEVRKVLDDFETVVKKCHSDGILSKEDEEILDYFEIDMAKALMKIGYKDSAEKIAKVILAYKGLSNEIKVKVE